jgi:hypothetical protein
MNTHFIVLGCIGGLIPDVIRLIKIGDTGIYRLPDYLKSWFFYFILILQVSFGGFLIYILKIDDALQALVYGYAGPQIFTSLAARLITPITSDANHPQNPGFVHSEPQNQNDFLRKIKAFY